MSGSGCPSSAPLNKRTSALHRNHGVPGLGPDYFYPTTPHRHSHSWVGGGKAKHHHHKSNSVAVSALTLLAFLFFLNLLQSCLREQMETMNPTVSVAGPSTRVPRNETRDSCRWM